MQGVVFNVGWSDGLSRIVLCRASEVDSSSGRTLQFPSKSFDQPFQADSDLCLRSSWPRSGLYDQVQIDRNLVADLSKAFANASLPSVSNDGVPNASRHGQPQSAAPQLSSNRSDGQDRIGCHHTALVDAVELRSAGQAAFARKGLILHAGYQNMPCRGDCG